MKFCWILCVYDKNTEKIISFLCLYRVKANLTDKIDAGCLSKNSSSKDLSTRSHHIRAHLNKLSYINGKNIEIFIECDCNDNVTHSIRNKTKQNTQILYSHLPKTYK